MSRQSRDSAAILIASPDIFTLLLKRIVSTESHRRKPYLFFDISIRSFCADLELAVVIRNVFSTKHSALCVRSPSPANSLFSTPFVSSEQANRLDSRATSPSTTNSLISKFVFSDFFSDHNSPVSLSFVALLLGHDYQYHDFESITKSRKSSCRGSENILQNRAPLKGAVPPTTPPASFQRLRRTLHCPRLPQYTNILHPFPLQVAFHPLQVFLTHPFVRLFYTRSLLLRRQLPLTLPQTMILSRAPCPDDVFKSEHLASSQREGALLHTNDATAELSHFPKRLSLTTPTFRLTSET